MHRLVKLNEAEVASEDGYKVKYGRDTLTYVESSRRVLVPIEHLGAPYEMAVYLDLADGWLTADHSKVEIDQGELSVVAERISACLTFLGRNFSIRR